LAQDSSKPEFWDTRFRSGVTPWDAGAAPTALADRLAHLKPSSRVLIPGCGTGYEVRRFAELGHDVLAIDFSDAALDAARRELGPLASRVMKADFFDFDAPPFDLVYERAFLCALPRRCWHAWSARLAQLVRGGGELAGLFYFDDNERGPPFGISREQLGELLEGGFSLSQDESVSPEHSLPVFKGKERWQVWTRKL
jgi:SAM-dependent methyltransferase